MHTIKYSVFIYCEAEPHAMYAIYKQTRTLCVPVPNVPWNTEEFLGLLLKNPRISKEVLGTIGKGSTVLGMSWTL